MNRIFFILALMVPLAGNGQSILSGLMSSNAVTSSQEQIAAKVDRHVADLTKAKSKFDSEREFLEYVFQFTHRKMLKTYVAYTQFNELVETGKFDCLSATALFSVIFDRLNIDYQIQETNYHIFLLAETQNGKVLLETTDRLNGFVAHPEKIEQRIQAYRQNQLATENKNFYEYQADIFQPVSADRLVGLLYFNQAVRLYNQRDFIECGNKLDEAIARYETPRTDELAVILVHSINASNLAPAEKSKITTRYQKYVQKARPVLASR